MIKSKTLRFLMAQGISFGAAAIGGLYTSQGVGAWYDSLNRPPFTPPNWVFGPVWTLLYFLMGYALYRVWNKTKQSKQWQVWKIFLVQLLLNISWSYLFFAAKQPPLALVNLLVLWLAVGVMIVKFMKIDRLAGIILIPYLLWSSFAMALNYAIVALN